MVFKIRYLEQALNYRIFCRIHKINCCTISH